MLTHTYITPCSCSVKTCKLMAWGYDSRLSPVRPAFDPGQGQAAGTCKSWTSAQNVGLELMNSVKSPSSTGRDRAKIMAQNLNHTVVM